MRRRLTRGSLLVIGTALAALLLTITRPSPEGLLSLGIGDREVRAAPGMPPVAKRHALSRLEVVSQTLFRIRDNYVDPTRIAPREMLYAALDSVEYNIPEVLVETDRDKEQIRVVVNDKERLFSAAEVNSPWRLTKTLKMIFRFMETNMNQGADLANIEYAAVNGMLGTLDPHSILLDPEMAADMDAATEGEFGGLGIVISMRNKKLTVVRPMENTPASEAGIKARDVIVKINNEVTENLTLNESVSRMRGAAGSSVTLWIQRAGETDLRRFDLTRRRILLDTVKARMLPGKVGYLKVSSFAGNTTNEVKKELRRLSKQGAKAWIMDLRWNPGGLLEQAIELSNLFVERGTLVTTVSGGQRESHRAESEGTYKKRPLALLVNGGSASASEIVAGALKNLDRAVVIGTTTFGKGSVQLLYDNKDGTKLKLTIAQYLTPGDKSIQSLGIAPDIALHRIRVPGKNDAPSDVVRLLQPRHKHGEKDLKSHLNSNYAVKGEKPVARVSFVHQEKKRDKNADAPEDLDEPAWEEHAEEDFEMRFARELLSSIGNKRRSRTLAQVKALLRRVNTEQSTELQAKLAKLGVDWSGPKASTATQVTGRFEIVSTHNGTAKAGERVQLRGSVTNKGALPAYQVHARTESDDTLFDELEQVFGKLEPGETRTWTTHVKVPTAARDRVSLIKFDVTSANGEIGRVNPLKLRIEAAQRPSFAYHHHLLDDSNGDGLVQPGEKYRLRVEIKNVGTGAAKDTSAILRNASGSAVQLTRARFELGEMKPGDKRVVEFAFKTRPSIKTKTAAIEMTVIDAKLGETVTEKLRYPVRKPSVGPRTTKGQVHFFSSNTPIFEGAATNSARVANAARDAVLRLNGTLNGWHRVTLPGGNHGFVPVGAARKTRGPAKRKGVSSHWQVTPPLLSLKIPAFETDKSHYSLRGTATDDNHIEDVYVYVSNSSSKIDNQKVFYRSNRRGQAGSRMQFDAKIPLWPGANTISVVARENDDVRTLRTFTLHRNTGTTTAALPSASP